jgi:ribonuclease HI
MSSNQGSKRNNNKKKKISRANKKPRRMTLSDAGWFFISPLGVHMRYVIRLHFAASNNVAKYEPLIVSLRITIELGVQHLDVRGDSQLVID